MNTKQSRHEKPSKEKNGRAREQKGPTSRASDPDREALRPGLFYGCALGEM
jgi:hypothetical protein